mgnify:CR=1 FL=1
MTIHRGEERTISGILKGKEDFRPGEIRLIIDSQFFQSQYPQKISCVEELGELLTTGSAMTLKVRAGNLRKNKDGSLYSGELPWQYWWDVTSIEDNPEPEAAVSVPQTFEQRQERNEQGQAKGNANNVAATLIAAYVQASEGKVPTVKWVEQAARALVYLSDKLIEGRTPESSDTEDVENFEIDDIEIEDES